MAKKNVRVKKYSNGEKRFIRHLIATVAYRGEKVVRKTPPGFPETRIGTSSRTPLEILAHINDLFDWAGHLVRGEQLWAASQPADWSTEVRRFYRALKNLDRQFAGTAPIGCDLSKLVQGPIADALTHIGQLAMLRRLAGAPVRGENYFIARISSGRVGPAQSKRRVEFD